MKFLIVTGLSGAGKSVALNYFEDKGYFCVDNMPSALLSKFAELCYHSELEKIAVVIDIRGGQFFDSLSANLSYLKDNNIEFEILFLEASTKTLISRYKETRRRHPLKEEGRVYDAINKEKKILEKLRGMANKIIDTSDLSIKQLYSELQKVYDFQHSDKQSLSISIISFGFKYGIPMDTDLLFDVRFLPNPHYVDSLKRKTGKDKEVEDYVMKWPVTQTFYEKFLDLIIFLLPEYNREGKSHLSIAIGCTGGKHRSVTLACKLKDYLKVHNYQAAVEHRDIDK